MNRRNFIGHSVKTLACLLGGRAFGQVDRPQHVHINLDYDKKLGLIPTDFIGLGYEISAIAKSGLLSAQNRSYVQMVRALAQRGVIRVGGNTSDYSSFAADGKAVSAPKATVVNEANLKELGTFLEATGWKLIWGLNLGGGTEQEALDEARAVAAIANDHLLGFEIGNEPDLFGHGATHRKQGYSYEDYLSDYRRYKAVIRTKLPRAPFAGPDAASATDWVTRFATDEGGDLKLLTHHYYRECANPTSTLDKLLHSDPKLIPSLERLRTATSSSGVPYRICEANSFCGGGKPGVSDTFGSALWVLDYMFLLASHGAAGVNIQTDVNHLGFISSYSPIGDDERGGYSAKPSYYGMMAFANAARGEMVETGYDAAGVNLTAYAVMIDERRAAVTIINKDTSHDVDATIGSRAKIQNARALRLKGPSLESKDGVTLEHSVTIAGGRPRMDLLEPLRSKGNECDVHVPAASAAILYFEA